MSFEVGDTGPGIPAEKIAAVFRPFEQADTSITRKYGGTGLGLAIAARLVDLMGGRIEVDSVVGQGSTFRFAIRFGMIPHPGAGLDRGGGLGGGRVLVVADNNSHRASLVETLQQWQLQPAVADGVGAALAVLAPARAAGEPFSLVVLDAHLPAGDGWALAEQLRQQPGLAGATLMILASTDGPGEVTRCRELGINAWLTKPVLPSELRDTLLRVLGKVPGDAGTHLATAPPRAIRPLRVLVIEDNPINQVLMVDLLEKLGHAAVTASGGAQALTTLDQQAFDVVLMDLQMPEMSGFEVTAHIRRREQFMGGHVSIIAVTAHAMKGDRERCLDAGMDDYLAKPLQAHELQAILARVASGETGR